MRGLKCSAASFALKLKIILVIVSIAIGLFACTSGKTGRSGIVIADSSSYEASIYRQNCAICHGAEANGKMVDGTMVPSLRFGDAAKKSKEEIFQQIAHGKLPMPSFENQLSEKEMQQMVRFIIEDLQGRKYSKNSK
ncbi:MAG: cytochrome c [Pyrinomonadaceae bacterium]|nr:cytochrome c [Pyrinomonadaceae bacterium]